jgi:hypothetical protein
LSRFNSRAWKLMGRLIDSTMVRLMSWLGPRPSWQGSHMGCHDGRVRDYEAKRRIKLPSMDPIKSATKGSVRMRYRTPNPHTKWTK